MPEKKSEKEKPANQAEPCITEAQVKSFIIACKGSGKTEEEQKEYLKATFGIYSRKHIPGIGWDMALYWAKDKTTTKEKVDW